MLPGFFLFNWIFRISGEGCRPYLFIYLYLAEFTEKWFSENKRIMKTVNETITKQQANLCWNTSLSKFQLIYLTFKNLPGSNFVLPSWSQCPLIWAREDNLTQMVNRLSFSVFMVTKQGNSHHGLRLHLKTYETQCLHKVAKAT